MLISVHRTFTMGFPFRRQCRLLPLKNLHHLLKIVNALSMRITCSRPSRSGLAPMSLCVRQLKTFLACVELPCENRDLILKNRNHFFEACGIGWRMTPRTPCVTTNGTCHCSDYEK